MNNSRIGAVILIILGLALGYFLYNSEVSEESRFPFKLGLDLRGGTQLVYKADVSNIAEGEVKDSMSGLRDVIERRVNLFGVSEPVVQIEETGVFADTEGEQRLIVELPGVADVDEATKLIGETPLLEFKLEKEGADFLVVSDILNDPETTQEEADELINSLLEDTELTGRFLQKATLQFQSSGVQGFGPSEPVVVLSFNNEGQKIFAEITEKNVGKIMAIYLDGSPISAPVIRDAITTGDAVISGNFEPEEARTLVGRLNSGALPVPIELISTQKVGAVLGQDATIKGVKAGLVGLALVALFMVVWYRVPGLVAVLSLAVYAVIVLSLFKIFGITLTAAGIAGFIISIGMAVDANVLIFERLKEEFLRGKEFQQAVTDGFNRAWASIRDANISSLLTAVVLFWFGTSLIQGFALTFGLGVLVSMFSAITVTRTFLRALGVKGNLGKLFGSGFGK